jgi:hypothetical protein
MPNFKGHLSYLYNEYLLWILIWNFNSREHLGQRFWLSDSDAWVRKPKLRLPQGTRYCNMGSGAANKLLAKSAEHPKTQVGPKWARQDEKERKRRQFLATCQDGRNAG